MWGVGLLPLYLVNEFSLPPSLSSLSSFRVYLPVMPNNSPAVFGIVLGTKIWLYFTAMVFYYPTEVLVHYWWMHVALVVTLFVFYRVCKSDPGLIPRSNNPREIHRVSGCGWLVEPVLMVTAVFHEVLFCPDYSGTLRERAVY